jgi:hypothetical protein
VLQSYKFRVSMTRVKSELEKNNTLWLAWLSSLFAAAAVVVAGGTGARRTWAIGVRQKPDIDLAGHTAGRGVGN